MCKHPPNSLPCEPESPEMCPQVHTRGFQAPAEHNRLHNQSSAPSWGGLAATEPTANAKLWGVCVRLESQTCLTVPENLHKLKGKAEIEKPPACGCVLLVNAAKMSWVSQLRAFQLQLCTAVCPEQGSNSLSCAGAAQPHQPSSWKGAGKEGRNLKVKNEPLLKLAELLPRSFSST